MWLLNSPCILCPLFFFFDSWPLAWLAFFVLYSFAPLLVILFFYSYVKASSCYRKCSHFSSGHFCLFIAIPLACVSGGCGSIHSL